MKSLIILVILVLFGALLFVGGSELASKKSSQPSNSSGTNAKKNKSYTTNQTANRSNALPSPPITCSTSTSRISLSSDYTITGMGCGPSGVSNDIVLICNGALMNSATNVSMVCSTPNNTVVGNGVDCRGSANQNSSPGNLSLSYSCYASNLLSSNSIYSCTGEMVGYSTLAINLPLTVNCGS